MKLLVDVGLEISKVWISACKNVAQEVVWAAIGTAAVLSDVYDNVMFNDMFVLDGSNEDIYG